MDSERPARRSVKQRVLTALRLILGWSGVGTAVLALGGGVETYEPVVDCGGPAVRVVVNGHEAPEGRVDDCIESATHQVVGAAMFGLAGVALVAWRCAGDAARRRQEFELAQARASGVWRMPVIGRWFAITAEVIAVAITVLALLFGGLVVGSVFAIVWLSLSVLFHRVGVHPVMRFTSRGVEIRNPWRNYEVPWHDIENVASGYSGVEITRRDGTVVVAAVGQKSNGASLRGTRTYGDEVAEAIAARASERVGLPTAAFLPTTDELEANRWSVRITVIVSLMFASAIAVIRIFLS